MVRCPSIYTKIFSSMPVGKTTTLHCSAIFFSLSALFTLWQSSSPVFQHFSFHLWFIIMFLFSPYLHSINFSVALTVKIVCILPIGRVGHVECCHNGVAVTGTASFYSIDIHLRSYKHGPSTMLSVRREALQIVHANWAPDSSTACTLPAVFLYRQTAIFSFVLFDMSPFL